VTSLSPSPASAFAHGAPESAPAILAQQILGTSSEIRYVAIYSDEDLRTAVRAGASAPSGAESDRYEELLVNPAILKLVTQRGNIDCGGARYVLIRYGNFYQWVRPLRGGHVSVCIEPTADVLQVVNLLEGELRTRNLL
jgi:hypothetical protein